ncbi:MAG: hypothetical protein ACOC93_03175, partial [Planctomycetota bacterium]
VMAGRDIIVAYTRVIASLTGGRTSARLSGKLKAIVQGGAIPVVLVLAWLPAVWPAAPVGWLRGAVAAIVTTVTLWSLVSYLRGVAGGIRQMASQAATAKGGHQPQTGPEQGQGKGHS